MMVMPPERPEVDARPIIYLWYHVSADWRDVLRGYLHALLTASILHAEGQGHAVNSTTSYADNVEGQKYGVASATDKVQRQFDRPRGDAAMATARDLLMRDGAGEAVLRELEEKGWWVGLPLIELKARKRLSTI